ncbi:IS4-like element ISApu2 family transposase [Aeromonas caviae]|nr:IS4-like element ISApu2 family transposase [Aeromonas caviae]
MTIINATLYLKQLLSSSELNRIGKFTGFCQRLRDIQPARLLPALLSGLGCDKVDGIAGLHRHFNALQLHDTDQIAYKPFHNQLRKQGFPLFMRALVERAIALRLKECLPDAHGLAGFEQVLLQDGSSFALHPQLAEHFPGRFNKHSPAAVECHMTMSLLDQSPISMSITADTESERKHLPAANSLNNKLLLADAGYISREYFADVTKAKGSYLVRGSQNLNPKVQAAYRQDGREMPKLLGKKLKDIDRRSCRAEVLDLDVSSGKYKYRLIRRWFAEEKRFCIWMTNLPRERWPAEKVMALYRCRWQIELLFKELKSHNRLKAFATRQKAIAEGLIWASLLALLVKRRLALTLIGSAELSMLKIAKNSALWLMPILASIIHGAWQEITEKLEWAMVYLSKNGKKSRQRKSKQNNTLDGIINSLAA